MGIDGVAQPHIGITQNFMIRAQPFGGSNVAATCDSGPPSLLHEVDLSRVESSHLDDSDRLLSRAKSTRVDLESLESLESVGKLVK